MERTPQNLANHGKFDPPFHFFAFPVVAISLIATIVHLYRQPSLTSAWFLVVAIAAVVLTLKLRVNALKVQDRLIRLEERLRLATLLPENLRTRIGDLTESQLVALRFASDSEVPALVQRALSEKLSNKDIKKAITNWRPDYFRV